MGTFLAIAFSLLLAFCHVSWHAAIAVADSLADKTTDQEKIIEKLKQAGARVEADEKEPKQLDIVLVGKAATDSILEEIGKLSNVAELAACGRGISDNSLKYIKSLNGLHRLDLRYTRITDKGLADISLLTGLKELRLDGNFRVSDAGLRQLERLGKLESLDLTLTKTTALGISDLQQALPKQKSSRDIASPK